MERIIHILDLDNTTIKVDVEPWIIDKKNPSEPLIRLRPGERKLIESETFRGEDYQISYSGKNYWISIAMYKELEKKTKKDIDLNYFGLSYAEFFDPELVAEQANKFEICTDNIEHLINTRDDVIIVSERNDLDLHSDLLDATRNKLKEFNIMIKNMYLLSKNNIKTSAEDVPLEKVYIAIEKMLGYKIVDDKFTKVPVDQYNKVFVYDDDRKVFEEMKTIQETFNKLYYASNDEMKSILMDKVLSSKPFVKIHQVTGNEFNRFNIENIMLKRPTRIYKYNFFK